MDIKVIITGATGMVGEGVMLECLAHPAVTEVLLLGRRPNGTTHPKLKECLVPDFLKLDGLEAQLSGYNACFFCAGVSSVGMNEADYTRLTYDTTLNVAQKLAALNPGMVFTYVSGAGTDSTEQGRVMWARVKGRTENALTRLPFRAVYNFRPGFIKALPEQRYTKSYYRYVGWLFPILDTLSPNLASTMQQLGQAMINSVLKGYPKSILEVKDFKELARV
ncbi:NAD-dependent epimerase/dehydratase family protein [Tellurirhabdus rosea]|uniref:NAD-dependent epimerase/dehydratase family protein n=1 Tax=Tellurirhabdus rosea TaxID=2674997 RepID=UPI00225274C2|nr:NAD-dependent epimerase/dehydratase family protein [Tellurirhabdus rosea]